MDDFLASITERLGIDSATAKGATAKVLAFVKSKLGDEQFSQLLSKIPGAADLVSDDGESSGGGGGGMFGGLAKMASSAIGGGAGDGVELAAALGGAGIGAEKAGPFLGSLMGFIKEKAGDSVIGQITEKIPALKDALG